MLDMCMFDMCMFYQGIPQLFSIGCLLFRIRLRHVLTYLRVEYYKLIKESKQKLICNNILQNQFYSIAKL